MESTNNQPILLYQFIRLIYEYWLSKRWSVITLLALPIAFMVVYHLTSRPKYKSSAAFKTENITYNIIEQITDPLLKASAYGKSDRLAGLINVDTETAKNIISIDLSEVKAPLPNSENCIFKLELETYESSIFAKVQDRILDYYKRNKYVQLIQKSQQKNLEMLSADVDEQISRLDSMQKMIPQAVSDQVEKSLLSDLGLGTLYSQMAYLSDKNFEVKNKLELVQEIKILSEFSFIGTSSGLLKRLIYGLIGGILLNSFLFMYVNIKQVLGQDL